MGQNFLIFNKLNDQPMKKIIFLFLIIGISANAQKEFWGVNTGTEFSRGYYGNITKYNLNGENPVIVHQFDSIHGYTPKGKMFLASNGKLYGTCSKGGNIEPQGSNLTAGMLYEYDLIFDKFRVLHYFDFDETFSVNPIIGVIEPLPGVLYGATGKRMYKYDIATETFTFYNALGPLYRILSEFIKASDGNLYSTIGYGLCLTPTQIEPWNGSIIKFNMATNHLSIVRPLNCDPRLEGAYPWNLVETSPGILYGVTYAGGIYHDLEVNGINPAVGTLFEYNINTNTLTKKIDFNGFTRGGHPRPIVKGTNGKLYGLCEEGGAQPGCDFTAFNRGTLYEYTPATNTLEIKQYFNTCVNTLISYPNSLMQTREGYFMGTIPNQGLFKYDAVADTIIMPDYSNVTDVNTLNTSSLIEICRKPSYHFFNTDSYIVCKNNPFSFDVQNTNATSYLWKKDGIVVENQTAGILNFTSLTLTDTGNYTCEMANECGTTVTMPLHLTVDSCLGLDEVIGYKNAIILHPNPTTSVVNIKLPTPQNFTIQKITVVNMLGQTVFSHKNNTAIDVSGFTKGLYMVQLQTDKGDWSGKFVKK